ILKKSVQLHKMARYLVEQCSLELLGDEKRIFLTGLAVVIEVVTEVISSKAITEWLQSYALEQLMELASRLYKLLVGGMKLINEHAAFVNPTSQIIKSTLKISRERQMNQPHFTLSLHGLFQFYQADREKLSSFLIWATSTALKSKSRKMFQCKESGEAFLEINDWITKFSDRSNSKTLQSLLECVPKGDKEGNKSSFDCKEMLAAQFFYLQQSLGINCSALPSVVSALCLPLCDDSKVAGLDFMLDFRTSMVTLCSMICCPPESNPAWRWDYQA
ncbi:hypothetical protein QQP08_020918, partial [Theobroma cacao]